MVFVNTFKVLILFLATLFAAKSQLPEDSCTAVGDLVCLSCSSLGTCVQGSDGGFEVELMEECLSGEFCDNSIIPECFSGNPSTTECTCFEDSASPCIPDPNNENAFVLCDAQGGTSEVCLPGSLDLEECVCTHIPSSTCETEGQSTCVTCSSSGTCSLVSSDPDVFEVTDIVDCLQNEYCDESISPQCFAGNPSASECTCTNTACISDPNNDDAFVHCDTDGTSEVCDTGSVDLASCSCV